MDRELINVLKRLVDLKTKCLESGSVHESITRIDSQIASIVQGYLIGIGEYDDELKELEQ